jgi:hypothetical protein
MHARRRLELSHTNGSRVFAERNLRRLSRRTYEQRQPLPVRIRSNHQPLRLTRHVHLSATGPFRLDSLLEQRHRRMLKPTPPLQVNAVVDVAAAGPPRAAPVAVSEATAMARVRHVEAEKAVLQAAAHQAAEALAEHTATVRAAVRDALQQQRTLLGGGVAGGGVAALVEAQVIVESVRGELRRPRAAEGQHRSHTLGHSFLSTHRERHSEGDTTERGTVRETQREAQ